MGRKVIDEIGNHYGRLTVLEEAGRDQSGNVLWFCQCECGNTTVVRGSSLRTKETQSCGCLQKERASESGGELPKGVGIFNNLVISMKRGAKKRGLKWDLSDEKVKELISKPCYYCGTLPSSHSLNFTRKFNGDFPSNGLDRIDNTKGYSEDNVVPCCKLCNQAKYTLTLGKFKNHVKNIYNHFILKKQITQINHDSIENWERNRGNNTLPKGIAASNYLIRVYKYSAKRRNLDWNLTDEETRNLMVLPCYYCGKLPVLASPSIQKQLNGYFLANGLDRIDNQKGYTKDNIVPCCKYCNIAKSTLTIEEFQDHIKKIYKHFINN